MPSPKGLPPPKLLRAQTERDPAALGSAVGVLAAVTAISSTERAPLTAPSSQGAHSWAELHGFSVTPAIGHTPNNKSSAVYHLARIAQFRRPIPSPGSPRAPVPA